jgi:FixJ family two-component response regulator
LRHQRFLARDITRGPGAIALVEDDPFVRRSLQRLLSTMGYDVSPFGSAEDFLANRAATRFSCLLLDIHLPGMSGHELVDHLIQIGDELPVVLISSDASALCIARSSTGRFLRILRKPVDADALELALLPAFAMGPA